MERINEQGGFMPYLLVLPTMLVVLVIAVYPILESIRISFLDDPLDQQGISRTRTRPGCYSGSLGFSYSHLCPDVATDVQ